jgi:uncharacterized phage-like protein YoqJ
MKQKPLILSVTGHRPDKLGGYRKSVTERLQTVAYISLAKLKPSLVLVGMANGWDQAIAWAAVNAHVPFMAYIPFHGQEKMWPRKSQASYHELLDYAQEVVVCSPGGYAPQKLHIRNHRIVDESMEVLALWNGVNQGGTAACLEYARKRQRPIHNVWNEWILAE